MWSVEPIELPPSAQWRPTDDGLMVIFFFVVGLEIKYEIVARHLRDLRVASVPIIAAFGGMAVPALVFVLIAGRSEGAQAWGIPMATYIAFAAGILSLPGSRILPAARIFLLTLAVVVLARVRVWRLPVYVTLGRLPERTTWPMRVGLGIVGGVGFTVSLFIVGLSSPQDQLPITQAKVGVLAAST